MQVPDFERVESSRVLELQGCRILRLQRSKVQRLQGFMSEFRGYRALCRNELADLVWVFFYGFAFFSAQCAGLLGKTWSDWPYPGTLEPWNRKILRLFNLEQILEPWKVASLGSRRKLGALPRDLATLEPWRARFMPGFQQSFLQRFRQGVATRF